MDPTLTRLKETIITGWPRDIKELPGDIRSFWSFRDQLSVENGLLLKGPQIVIPRNAQEHILQQLHTAHLGQEKTKLLAREIVYWIDINRDIDRLIQGCKICQHYQPSQAAEPLLPHDIPTKPWSVVATDIFQFDGSNWLIIADMYSKYPIVRKLPQHAPSSTIARLMKQLFGEFGIPEKIVSDNGPHFVSESFRSFTQAWEKHHVTTSPRRPQANGFIERQVRTIKGLLKKAKKSGTHYDLTHKIIH
jgi:transposase InsO family protein